MILPLQLPAYEMVRLAALTPEELIGLLIADEDRVPRTLIDACAQRGDAMCSLLRVIMHDEYFWTDTITSGEWWLLLHAVMILGLMDDKQAGSLLVDYMYRMDETDDVMLQDWLAGYWPALFRNKPAAVATELLELAEDPDCEEYIRINAAEAVVAMAQQAGAEQLEAGLSWLARRSNDRQENMPMRLAFGSLLLDFPREQYRDMLVTLEAKQGRIGKYFDRANIEAAYLRKQDKPDWVRFDTPWKFYEPQEILQRQARWENVDAQAQDDELFEQDEADLPSQPVPIIPKTGRNDPCPCGSGKKYKKCCLAKQ